MPISHSKKVVFVHVPKTAGTTIERALGMMNSESLYNHRYDEELRVCPQHLYPNEILQKHPQAKDYYWFAVVRNPLDRFISEYHHINLIEGRGVEFRGLSFSDFVKCLDLPQEERMFLFDRHLEPQINFINKHVHVFKYEQLNECFEMLKQKFRIPFFTHERKSFRGEVSDYYDKYLEEKVRSFYKQDFEAFGY